MEVLESLNEVSKMYYISKNNMSSYSYLRSDDITYFKKMKFILAQIEEEMSKVNSSQTNRKICVF